MHPILLYLLKMALCSGILYGYYRVALYNERFHQWNRFYLLAALLLSMVVPLLEIPLVAEAQPMGLIYVIETLPAAIVAKARPIVTTEQIIRGIMLLISLILLARLAWGLYITIYKPYRNGDVSSREDIDVVITETPSAPYSFFRLLFWRSNMDPDSPHGKRVLLHELTHIREKHSADKLFAELLLVVFWFNPFFWLIRKELYIIHEFLADRKAIEQNNGAAFAEMILQTMNAGHLSPLTNPFFSSHLKRRLKMITTSNKPQFSYLRRITALAAMVTISLVLMLTIEKGMAQQAPPPPPPPPAAPPPPPPPQKISLPDSIKSIDVVDRNGHCTVKVVLKSGKVRTMPLEEALKKGYPLPPPPPPAPAPPAPPAAPAPPKANQLAGETTNFLQLTPAQEPLYIYAGIEITKEQLNSITPDNIASINVLKGEKAIAVYGDKGKNGVIIITPKMQNAAIDENLKEVVVQGYASKKTQNSNPVIVEGYPLKEKQEPKEVVVIGYSSKSKPVSTSPNSIINLKGSNAETHPLYVLNGKIISTEEASTILSTGVESIHVLKDKSATDKYGDKGKNGVIEIITKENDPDTGNQQGTYDKVFTKMEQAPAYPGGKEAWLRYLQKNLRFPDEAFDLHIDGTVEVQFIVDKTGKVGNIQVTKSPHVSFSKEAVRLISAGGNWEPGQQNNIKVNARVTQSIVFKQDYPEKKPAIVKN